MAPIAVSTCEIVLMPVAGGEFNLPYRLRIMMEHAIFIENGLPCVRQDLIDQAVRFQNTIRSLLSQAEAARVLDPSVLQRVTGTAASFLGYKRMPISLALKCQVGGLGGFNFPLLLDHIARGATLFLHILESTGAAAANPFELVLAEEAFWFRIMTDHAKFITSLLDQSERGFIQEATRFSEIFDRLLRQAQDYRSMLQADPNRFPAAARFTDEIKSKRKASAISNAPLMSSSWAAGSSPFPPLLAGHVAREAEHFLEVLAEIRQGLPA